jgi:hypothetical protein
VKSERRKSVGVTIPMVIVTLVQTSSSVFYLCVFA